MTVFVAASVGPAEAQPAFDQKGGPASTRVVVRLRPEAFVRADLRRAHRAAEDDVLPRLGARFRAAAANARAVRMQRACAFAFGAPALAEKYGLDRTYVLETPRGTDTVKLAAQLSALEDVESASPDALGGVTGEPLIPSDTNFFEQWGMHNTGQVINGISGSPDADIDAPEAWAIHTGEGGEQVIVAVVDSGISSHPEFGTNLGVNSTGRILPGWNTVTNTNLPTDLQDTCGLLGHGTHVAGIIAAGGGSRCGGVTTEFGAPCDGVDDCPRACVGGANGGLFCLSSEDCPNSSCGTSTCSAIGVAGVSWGAYLLPVKVLTNCEGFVTELLEGIIWAADHNADVINASLQYRILDQPTINALQNAIDYAHDLGVLLVAATGNADFCGNGLPPVNDTVCFPARLPNVFAVTATDNNDALGAFANYGPEVGVAAPGKDIKSTVRNGGYNYQFGTSFAAPHVSGLAALIKSYVPTLTNDEIAEVIMTTAEDRGDPGFDIQFGFGRINAPQALRAAAVWPGIVQADPPDGAIDARQPVDRATLAPQGWFEVEVEFLSGAGGVAAGDFLVEHTAAGPAPIVAAVEPIDAGRARLILDRPIEPLAWTTIEHVPTGTRIRLGFLPGDVNSDRATAAADILVLIDALNSTPSLPLWSMDIDRSGAANPADILQAVDLLNGAAPFDAYIGASLPPMP